MKKLLEKFFELKTEIYKYFGKELEYYSIHDYSDEYWKIDELECIQWGPNKEEVECYCEDIYGNERGVHRTKDFTLILVERGHHDELYHVYDNSKEVKEE